MTNLTGKTRLLAVIGDPIGHSLSPLMQNAALAELGLDYAYVALRIAGADLPVALDGFRAIGLYGFNVTIPHKQAVLPLLGQVSAVAEAVGAVNTVWWDGDRWCGTNTDVEGFLSPLRPLARDWSRQRAVILGNGGAARAVVAACQMLGLAETWVVGRDPERLAAFERSFADSPLRGNLHTALGSELERLLPEAGLVVNSTPIGMSPQTDASPLSEAQAALLDPAAIAYDLIYVPSPTRFLQQAAARGCTTFDGLEMLVGQGAVAQEIWTGRAPNRETMRRVLRQHLFG